jgi:hypothetical protein
MTGAGVLMTILNGYGVNTNPGSKPPGRYEFDQRG